MAVYANIILQLVTHMQIIAIRICPVAHPIDRTIGVDALDI